MKKLLPIILVVFAIGVGGYLYMQRSKTSVMDQGGTTGQEETGETGGTAETETGGEEAGGDKETYTGTLKKMVDLGVPLKCTYTQEGGFSGTTWVKGKKFYTEVEAEGQSGKIIFKDDCMWNWSEGQEQGIKMCFDPEEADDMFSGEADTGQTNLPTDVDFNCKPAVFTDAKFNPPNDIEFMDMDQMMQQFSQ